VTQQDVITIENAFSVLSEGLTGQQKYRVGSFREFIQNVWCYSYDHPEYFQAWHVGVLTLTPFFETMVAISLADLFPSRYNSIASNLISFGIYFGIPFTPDTWYLNPRLHIQHQKHVGSQYFPPKDFHLNSKTY